MSMLIQGEVRGVRKVNRGEYSFSYLVIEDSEMRSHELQLGREFEQDFSMLEKLDTLKGKQVQAPFYIRKFSGKSGTGFSLNYEGDKLPVEVKAPNLKAATS